MLLYSEIGSKVTSLEKEGEFSNRSICSVNTDERTYHFTAKLEFGN